MSNHIEDKKADKVSNVIDLTLVIVASVAYLMHIEYPSLSKFITNGVGFIFIVLVIPHFIMMFNEKKILNYHFLKYIIETCELHYQELSDLFCLLLYMVF